MSQADTPTTCLKHPKVSTNLRCASCGVPICPRCLVQTPVGAKCRQCGLARGGVLFSPSPLQALAACGAGLLAGSVVGLGVQWLGLFGIFLALAYGPFAGEMIMRAGGRKRGLRMQIIAGAGMGVGALATRLLMAAVTLPSVPGHPPFGVFDVLLDLVTPTPFPAMALVVAIAAAIGRIRYL